MRDGNASREAGADERAGLDCLERSYEGWKQKTNRLPICKVNKKFRKIL